MRRRSFPLLLAGLACAAAFAPPVAAHGPTRQKVTETVTVNAPAAQVWARIGDFAALKDWHPAVADSPVDKGNEVGSVRSVKLKGSTFRSRLGLRSTYVTSVRPG